eukprot:UN24222
MGSKTSTIIEAGSRPPITDISEIEIENILRLRSLEFSQTQLVTDFGEKLSQRILKHFRLNAILETHYGVNLDFQRFGPKKSSNKKSNNISG